MLTTIGRGNIEELFDDIPGEIRLPHGLDLPEGLSEWEVTRRLEALAGRNRVDRVSFLGGGSYDHFIPATVRHVIARPEFATAYTPYQAEISQGILQAIFEYQSMMCMLTGLDVSNASLYDGATAAVEGCSIALQNKRRADTILYSAALHPNTKQVLETSYRDRNVRLEEIAAREGTTSLEALEAALDERVAAVVVQSPNFYGCLEELDGFAEAVHAHGALLIVSANPLSLALFRPPGEWGADIAVGDTQVLGFPPSYGGPSAGYITAREGLLRRMPGRIVGQTVDREGRRAFVLTLQAREQHIKRERASSNICTNQALVALGNAAYLATLGQSGLEEVCRQNVEKAQYLHDRVLDEPGIEAAFAAPFFNEFTVRLPRRADGFIRAMAERGFLAGFSPGSFPANGFTGGEADRLLTIAVTEKRTRSEMEGYLEAMREVLGEAGGQG